ncbi:hypothetical protein GCM10018785_13770 [Streptomyces longispororuber]|uniref:Uncharacterized protein n=1 Tax=Streptomyces longispororuber TaxID=68230 RepID=A0A918ZC04_9ACTN|nr:hypothetical protein GCM10018785_13770 [Streptomyces longispororuber]
MKVNVRYKGGRSGGFAALSDISHIAGGSAPSRPVPAQDKRGARAPVGAGAGARTAGVGAGRGRCRRRPRPSFSWTPLDSGRPSPAAPAASQVISPTADPCHMTCGDRSARANGNTATYPLRQARMRKGALILTSIWLKFC